jgi:AraC-like DNA-binding protein
MEMRMLKAASMLRDPDTKVINVAERCGFNHLGLFNTCFKKRFGATPGQWRKLSAKAEGQSALPVSDSLVCPLRSHGYCPWTETSMTVNRPKARRLKLGRPARQDL